MVPDRSYENVDVYDAFYCITRGRFLEGVRLLEAARKQWVDEVDIPDTPLQRFLLRLDACQWARLEVGGRTLEQVVDDHCFDPFDIGWLVSAMGQEGLLIDPSFLEDDYDMDLSYLGEYVLDNEAVRATVIESINKALTC